MSSIQIKRVDNKKDLKTFIRFPHSIYRNDPNWVPPLEFERHQFFDRKKNPFFHHGEAQLFLAMKNGEVLVSGSTGPEMILACKKAGAIVTEEGGMLTHATIVSRELGIPCVVGTKIATKIFETGDMIEVDADNGVVRKL